jgi:hypothetical protein
MLVRLFSDSLFNLADSFLNFSVILFSSAVNFQVGVSGKLTRLLLDCAFDFVEIACCLIIRARFHNDSLLCSGVDFNCWKFIESRSRFDVCDPVKSSVSKVSLPILSLLWGSIQQSGCRKLLAIAHRAVRKQPARSSLDWEASDWTAPACGIGGAADLLNVRIPVVHLRCQLPGHEQAPAARVFDLKYSASEQALTEISGQAFPDHLADAGTHHLNGDHHRPR